METYAGTPSKASTCLGYRLQRGWHKPVMLAVVDLLLLNTSTELENLQLVSGPGVPYSSSLQLQSTNMLMCEPPTRSALRYQRVV